MGMIIEIKDTNPQGILKVDLLDILKVIEPEGRTLTWSILDLEATGDMGDGNNMLDLEQEVNESPTGLRLNWDDLVSLATRLYQVINGVIVGSSDATISPSWTLGYLHHHNEFVIEAIDSSLWRIFARDDAIIERLLAAFNAEQIATP